jgi:hypothetical protein
MSQVIAVGMSQTVPDRARARHYSRAMNEYFRPVALEHASRLINHGPT